MDRVTCEPVTIIVIPPAKLFKAFVLNANNLIRKVAPHAIQKTEILDGDGGPGTIKKITFVEIWFLRFSILAKAGSCSHCKYVKYRMDKVDDANFKYGYSLVEGDALGEVLEKISSETTFVQCPDGGCILKRTSKYFIKGDHEIKNIRKKQVNSGKEKVLFAVEAYLPVHV
ncbi:Major pollen allergen Bet v 1-M/N [Morella rubra]|uniref:Major pollen allergen Bet v 1-M/N n=1 Tax=Morella rubra TaxID=262757 RepID=A0A6A1VLX3_9ROSI|nr:Major pollen allergen Bet v 1-M/N [Morella rubra]